ncbi:uncharacterized protein LACBIDRAFT_321399 [Laccaria bicolor S238N-H82]|uniref:Predicted protein n=1 Tax=Laccaria bicolor (strain S238N-H82 / ATCC MYA-4686) TaxID=486041 RepID=B0CQ17_LACBS|nr:uncharacterized protein LACBIDRAFT_321399 [Laccaria bicolor S238N-H82]EDR15511.1 predicted protein [Laccaria bicolor S238N-H82]|eukprot:XP_001873719.1 predicted protein [Laccaria bicolor S238N-H82]
MDYDSPLDYDSPFLDYGSPLLDDPLFWMVWGWAILTTIKGIWYLDTTYTAIFPFSPSRFSRFSLPSFCLCIPLLLFSCYLSLSLSARSRVNTWSTRRGALLCIFFFFPDRVCPCSGRRFPWAMLGGSKLLLAVYYGQITSSALRSTTCSSKTALLGVFKILEATCGRTTAPQNGAYNGNPTVGVKILRVCEMGRICTDVVPSNICAVGGGKEYLALVMHMREYGGEKRNFETGLTIMDGLIDQVWSTVYIPSCPRCYTTAVMASSVRQRYESEEEGRKISGSSLFGERPYIWPMTKQKFKSVHKAHDRKARKASLQWTHLHPCHCGASGHPRTSVSLKKPARPRGTLPLKNLSQLLRYNPDIGLYVRKLKLQLNERLDKLDRWDPSEPNAYAHNILALSQVKFLQSLQIVRVQGHNGLGSLKVQKDPLITSKFHRIRPPNSRCHPTIRLDKLKTLAVDSSYTRKAQAIKDIFMEASEVETLVYKASPPEGCRGLAGWINVGAFSTLTTLKVIFEVMRSTSEVHLQGLCHELDLFPRNNVLEVLDIELILVIIPSLQSAREEQWGQLDRVLSRGFSCLRRVAVAIDLRNAMGVPEIGQMQQFEISRTHFPCLRENAAVEFDFSRRSK